MFKNKLFLYGLGIGLLTAALLLELLSYAEQDQLQPATELINWNVSFTDDIEQLQSIADEHGYRIISNATQLYTEEQLEARLQQDREQYAQLEIIAESERIGEVDSDLFEIVITKGMFMNDVAEALVQSGLLQDDIQFREIMSERRLNTRIKYGTYEFTKFVTAEEIIDQITLP